MKKIIFILIIMTVAVSVNLFADITAFEKVNYTLEVYGLNDYSLKSIQQLSSELTYEQKFMTLNKYKVSGVGPFFLNFFIGFGSGSWMQGDTNFAIAQTVLDVVGATMLIITFIDVTYYTSLICLSLGGAMLFSSRIIGWVRPWVYSNKVNKELKEALGSNPNNFAIIPIIKKDGIGLMASIKI